MKTLLAAVLSTLPVLAAEPPVVALPPCCAPNSRSAVFEIDPLVDTSRWDFSAPDAWKWTIEPKPPLLRLTAQSNTKPDFRSPLNMAWYKGHEWSDFTLTMECRLTKFDAGNNDLCIAFGGDGKNRFYYAHLGEKADEAHHQIHVVDHADRKPVTTYRTAGTPWKQGQWHKVKLVRNSATGDIGVWFDDMEKPVLTAKDKRFTWGRIGLGSFDDLGEFRNVRIKGNSR